MSDRVVTRWQQIPLRNDEITMFIDITSLEFRVSSQ